jgi:rRNA maturation endonuclease Nob1
MGAVVVFIVYGGVFLLIVALAVLFYLRSVASRRRYRCPNCGEEFRVELMEASHCSFCGAPLKENSHA